MHKVNESLRKHYHHQPSDPSRHTHHHTHHRASAMNHKLKIFIAAAIPKHITTKHKNLVKQGFKIIDRKVSFIKANEIPPGIPPAEMFIDMGITMKAIPILAISPIEIPQPEIQKVSDAIGTIILLAYPTENKEYILN